MDMNIAGRGTIFPGSYKNIKISGRATATGVVNCTGLEVSGKFESKTVNCSGLVKVSGSSYFENDMKAGGVDISGSLKCDKSVTITGESKIMGSLSCANLKAENMVVRGSVKCESDIEAENVSVIGMIYCDGKLKAKELEIKIEGGAKLNIGSIECPKISIAPEYLPKNLVNRHDAGVITVGEIIGEDIYLENVIADVVKGKNVTIGEGCEIGKVEMM